MKAKSRLYDLMLQKRAEGASKKLQVEKDAPKINVTKGLRVTEVKTRTHFQTISRSGSNHIHCSLHAQDKCFAFAERVPFPKEPCHGALGFREEVNDEKFGEAEHLFWKMPVGRQSNKHIIKDCQRLNASCFFYVRHPLLVLNSWLNRKKMLEADPIRARQTQAKIWAATEDQILDYYAQLFERMDHMLANGINTMMCYHEDMLVDPDKALTEIFETAGVPVPSEFVTVTDYVKEVHGDNVPDGYGDYKPLRVITIEDEIEKLRPERETAERMITWLEQEPRLNTETILSTAQEFCRFYRALHNGSYSPRH